MSGPRFKPGDTVRVLDLHKPGHVRIPYLVRRRSGTIERHCGAYLVLPMAQARSEEWSMERLIAAVNRHMLIGTADA